MSDRAGALGLLTLAILLLAPGLLAGPSLDAAVFAEVASYLRDGAVPYVGAWDHKPPGIFLVLALAQALLPFAGPWIASWAASLVATVGIGIGVATFARRLGIGGLAAWLGAAVSVIVAGQYLTALGGGLTEPIAVAIMASALLLALDPRGARAVALGALLAAAVLVSIPAVAGSLVCAMTVARGSGSFMGTALRMGVGAVLPLVAVGIWLAANGALGAAADAVIGYSGAYHASTSVEGASLSGPVASWTVLSLTVAFLPAATGFLAGLRSEGDLRAWSIASASWIGLSIVLFVMQGRFFAHYAIPLAIPFGLLASFGFASIGRRQGRGAASRRLAVAPLLVTLAISVVAGSISGGMEWGAVARQNERAQQIAAEIQRTTSPADEVWVWGNAPQVYLIADRRATSRYIYLYPLVTPGYSTPALIESTLRSLEESPPAVIVDAGSAEPGVAGFQPLLIDRPLATDGRDLDILDPLREFVMLRYAPSGQVDGWPIYRRSDDS